ncbi:uncharacterized protein SAPINGB_P004558 [Magnusiomyces paraingens]|uniref:NADH:flavin oxidoreductase/NADH oxidase N-terminal domain-containing protein n=1 Tax=Magnusiomyces paraingens TaxID=2606893 RepID=A0A5E8BW83_9ASCO|nr:uncharacterized protein SAPINGB_P004558 [Saprochaete ingens]VVT55361.1 unnamed protein product [Saprochaete ingens]
MSADLDTNLFRPLKVGRIEIKQRIAMGPLTRVRCNNKGAVPNDLMVEYYEQRASSPGTLIISEATFITPRAGGFRNVPGIWSKEQIEGWKKVTSAVHAKGSFIYMQLWALGRAAGYDYLTKELGYDYVSSSNVPDLTNSAGPLTKEKGKHIPRPLTIAEIKQYVKDYAQAAKNAIEAGFDGIEIHSANGYILDQFIRHTANKRTDEYGGSVENRARFTLEVVDAIVAAIGADRTAIRLSPFEKFGGMSITHNSIPQFSYLIEQLELRGLADGGKNRLAYIHIVENIVRGKDSKGNGTILHPIEFVRYIWTGVWIRTQGYKRQTAIDAADKDDKVIIGFGKGFIANPDLVRRLRENLPWNQWDIDTFYTLGPKGYVDYPFYSDSSKAKL